MIVFLLILTAVILGGSYFAYRMAFHSPARLRNRVPSTSSPQYDPYRKRMKEIFEELSRRPFETVTIRSRDGLTLSGRYYHTAEGAPLDICFHGYKSHPFTDFSGGSGLCIEMGHNLLLIDQRAHHASEGKAITFGIQERWDALSWVEYAIDRFGSDVKITLYGISMGGATVLMAAGLSLPEQVKGIIADCPYAKAEDIILDVGRKLHYPPGLIRPFLHLGAFLFGGFRLNETDAVRSVQNTKVPIVIIHGEADSFVPCEMSRENHEACTARKRLVTIPGAGHGLAFMVEPERYLDELKDFFKTT